MQIKALDTDRQQFVALGAVWSEDIPQIQSAIRQAAGISKRPGLTLDGTTDEMNIDGRPQDSAPHSITKQSPSMATSQSASANHQTGDDFSFLSEAQLEVLKTTISDLIPNTFLPIHVEDTATTRAATEAHVLTLLARRITTDPLLKTTMVSIANDEAGKADWQEFEATVEALVKKVGAMTESELMSRAPAASHVSRTPSHAQPLHLLSAGERTSLRVQASKACDWALQWNAGRSSPSMSPLKPATTEDIEWFVKKAAESPAFKKLIRDVAEYKATRYQLQEFVEQLRNCSSTGSAANRPPGRQSHEQPPIGTFKTVQSPVPAMDVPQSTQQRHSLADASWVDTTTRLYGNKTVEHPAFVFFMIDYLKKTASAKHYSLHYVHDHLAWEEWKNLRMKEKDKYASLAAKEHGDRARVALYSSD